MLHLNVPRNINLPSLRAAAIPRMTTTGCDWQYCCNSGENASFLHSSWKEVIHGDKICLYYISLVMKNPVFGVFDKVGLKLSSSATENSYTLEILDLASIGIILSEQQTTKALISLHWCTGWSAPFLFAYRINRFFHGVAHLYPMWSATLLLVIWAATWQNQQSDCTPSEDSDQVGHPPSLIRVFTVRMKKAWVHSYPLSAQWRLWSDWADAQVDLSLRWAHSHFVGFVMSKLKLYTKIILNSDLA